MHQEVLFRTKIPTDEQIIKVFRTFAEDTENWAFMQVESIEYTDNIGEPACMILLDDGAIYPAVAVAKKSNGIYMVSNIVPKEIGHLSIK